MSLANILGLVIVAAVGYWLSSHDSGLARDGRRSDFWRRFLRIVVTLFLVQGMIMAPPMTIYLMVFVGVVWAGCVAELFSHGFRRMVDPSFNDDRRFDPGKTRRYLDLISHLIKNDRRDEAIKLCEHLKETGEVELSTLEFTLEYLGVKQNRFSSESPLKQAIRLRKEGRLAEAEKMLNSLLVANPADVQAGMQLVRLYAQDLRQPDKAAEVLNALAKQSQVAASHIEFARRSLAEWGVPNPEPLPPADVAEEESIDQLLARKSYGTAVAWLEFELTAHPEDFDLWLQLAEVHAVHCHNVSRAGVIIQQMAAERRFSAGQMAVASGRLKEWQKSALQRK